MSREAEARSAARAAEAKSEQHLILLCCRNLEFYLSSMIITRLFKAMERRSGAVHKLLFGVACAVIRMAY